MNNEQIPESVMNERLAALKVLNNHFAHEPRFYHLEDGQVKNVLNAMIEFSQSFREKNKVLRDALEFADSLSELLPRVVREKIKQALKQTQ